MRGLERVRDLPTPFEISSIIALVVYARLAWVIARIFRLIFIPAHTNRRVTTYHCEL